MRLREWRESKGFSIKQMVTFLQMVEKHGYASASSAYQSLRNYEMGVSDFPIQLLPELREVTGNQVTLDDLLATRLEPSTRSKAVDAA